MDTITFEGKEYQTRTFDVICEGEERTYTIADESLFFAFGEDMDKWGQEAHKVDQQIYFYLPTETLNLSGEEICKDHLDIEMTFVTEDPE